MERVSEFTITLLHCKEPHTTGRSVSSSGAAAAAAALARALMADADHGAADLVADQVRQGAGDRGAQRERRRPQENLWLRYGGNPNLAIAKKNEKKTAVPMPPTVASLNKELSDSYVELRRLCNAFKGTDDEKVAKGLGSQYDVLLNKIRATQAAVKDLGGIPLPMEGKLKKPPK